MKKLLCLILALAMVLSLAACADKEEKEDGGKKENMSWRELMEEGRRLLEGEEYDGAIDVLSEAIELRETRSDLYVLRGQAYLGKGSGSALKKAVKDFEAALEITRDYEDAWIGLVEALIEQEEYEEALDRAREGLEVLGSNRELNKLLGRIEDELGTPGSVTEPGNETEPGYETRPGSEPEPEPEPEPTVPVHVHSWMNANYQEPRWCVECGEVDGDPLTPDFSRYGIYYISASDAIGTPFVYQTCVYDDPDIKTLGFLTLTDYRRFDSDGDIYPYQEGYEWLSATFRLTFMDENARNYGYRPAEWEADYYTIAACDDSYYMDEYGNGNFYVNWYGTQWKVMDGISVLHNQWEDEVATVILRYDAWVPVGYDGTVFGFYDRASVNTDSVYLNDVYNETFLLYRFD